MNLPDENWKMSLPDEKMFGGAKELRKTKEGAKYLNKLQQRHRLAILQPNDPLFYRVHGDKVARDKRMKEKQEKLAREERQEILERKKFDQKKLLHPGSYHTFI